MKVSHYLMAATAILLVSCGGSGSNQSSETTESDTATEGVESIGVAESTGDKSTEDTGEAADVTLTLNADDMMRFDKKELKVKAGQKVSLTLNHTGKLGKDVMGHHFVLLKADRKSVVSGKNVSVGVELGEG